MNNTYDNFTDTQLIDMLHQGDIQVETYLLEKYKPLVRKKSRALYLAGGDGEDLLQEGMMGLMKAIREYDPEKEASFVSFAGLCISHQLHTAIEASLRKKHQPLNASVSLSTLEESGEEYHLPNAASPEAILLDQEAARNILTGLKEALSPLENRVLDLYLTGLDYREVALQLGKSPKSVDNALNRIRTKAAALKGNI